MKCPKCDSFKTRVVDSREGADARSVRRRRECENCTFRFTTFERIEDCLPMVIKKGGQRESFDRYKMLSGLRKACEKRPISVLEMEDIVKSIETQLMESGEKEISSHIIGEFVIEKLRDIDQVAYVRFASVYRNFSDVSEFIETLKNLASSNKEIASSTRNVISLSRVKTPVGFKASAQNAAPRDISDAIKTDEASLAGEKPIVHNE